MIVILVLATFAVAATGWWGRYDLPVLSGMAVGGFIALTTDHYFHAIEPVAMGLILAYLRRPIVHPDWPLGPRQ